MGAASIVWGSEMKRLLWGLDRAVEALAALVLAASTVMMCTAVFYRYVLQSGLVWINEIPSFLLVWIAFLGAYLAYRTDDHIAFESVVDRVPARGRPFVRSFADLLVLGLALLVVSLAWTWIDRTGGTEIETMEIARGWFMAIIPISFALIAIALVVRIAERHRHGRAHRDSEVAPL